MIFYKVYEMDYEYGKYNGDTDVKYYISKKSAEEDLNKRREEWPAWPCGIQEIRTED